MLCLGYPLDASASLYLGPDIALQYIGITTLEEYKSIQTGVVESQTVGCIASTNQTTCSL